MRTIGVVCVWVLFFMSASCSDAAGPLRTDAGDATAEPPTDVSAATDVADVADVADASRDDDRGGGDAPDVSDVPTEPCAFMVCGGLCVDTGRDVLHCGSCERDCTRLIGVRDWVVRCEAGACVIPAGGCDATHDDCDGNASNGCETYLLQAETCGSCRRACADPTPVCSASGGPFACVSGCGADRTRCSGRCVDTMSDLQHCGTCGNACATDRRCLGGMCACPPGQEHCGTRCVNTVTDASNCGACGNACPSAHRCDAGRCMACPAGSLFCAGDADACGMDSLSNLDRCGACGVRCAVTRGGDAACRAGRCVYTCVDGAADCVPGTTFGGEGCETNLRTDLGHCGACGNACAAGALCVDGRCVAVPIRPKAPISMETVTSARPWLRWALPPGADGARVQVCAARQCASVEASWDATGASSRPPMPLSPGRHFWRLYARRGAVVDAAPGPMWMFVVPSDPSATRVTQADFNGDGADDTVTILEPGGVASGAGRWSLSVRLSGVVPTTQSLFGAPDGDMVHSVAGAYALIDLNGDGYGELGVHETGFLSRSFSYLPHALMFRGGPRGLEVIPSLTFFGMGGDGGTFGFLGAVVTLGDINGDGFGNVGSFETARRPGFGFNQLHMILGGASVRNADASLVFDCTPGVLARGDFDSDGFTDLVMARCATEFSGRAWIVMGAEAVPGATTELATCAGASLPGPTATVQNVVYDFDNDGYDDLRLNESVYFRGGLGGLTAARCGGRPTP